MDPEPSATRPRRLAARVGTAAVVGVIAAVAMGLITEWRYAASTGWTLAAALYVIRTWLHIIHMSPEQTATHATREDPTRAVAHVIVLLASVASLAGVVYLLGAGSGTNTTTKALDAGLGIASVVGSWAVVHTVYTLRYAELYYAGT